MASVDHVAERAHRSLGLALEPGAPDALAIHHGDLLARPQIRYRLGAQGACDPIRNAAAGATAIKAEHQAGTFSRPAMVERIDAECPMGADQPRLDPLQELKAWPPHQGTIAEDPDVVGIGHWVHPRSYSPKPVFVEAEGMDKAAAPEKDLSSERPHSPASSCAGTAEPAEQRV